MKRRLITVLTAACALSPLAAVPAGPALAQAVVSPAQEIVLSIGRGQLVTVPGSMTDIFVANDQVADVQVKSQRQLYVFGRAGGETTVYASNAAGDIVWSANVRVGSNLDSIPQMLGLAMPEAKINVATMGTKPCSSPAPSPRPRMPPRPRGWSPPSSARERTLSRA